MTVELSTLGSVIKTAYEGESDTNAFSDAYKALLDAYDVDLGTFSVPANTTISAFGSTLVDDANAAAAIATLGLDANIATLSVPASTTISAFGATLVDDADAATARATLGVDAAGTDNSTDVTFAYATSPELNYLTLTGQQITLNPIDLAADVTGTLPASNVDASIITGQAADSPAAAAAGDLLLIADVSASPVSLKHVTAQSIADLAGSVGGMTAQFKSAAYTAIAGDKVYVDCSGGAVTITLPATPATGAEVMVLDSSGDAATNNVTVARNGETIDGVAADFVIDLNYGACAFAYSGTDWKINPSNGVS